MMENDDHLERFVKAWHTWLTAPESPDAQQLRTRLPALLPRRRSSHKARTFAVLAAAASLIAALGVVLHYATSDLHHPPPPTERSQPGVVHTVEPNVVLVMTAAGDPVYVVVPDNG